MKIVIVLVILIVVMFFMEALYCRIASKHQIYSKEHEEKSTIISKKEKNIGKKIVSALYALIGDFTFLTFKVVGYIPSHAIRKFLYKNVYCMKLGKKCVIHFGLEARSPWNIAIGRGTIVGDHAIMDARYDITIGYAKSINKTNR